MKGAKFLRDNDMDIGVSHMTKLQERREKYYWLGPKAEMKGRWGLQTCGHRTTRTRNNKEVPPKKGIL